MRWSRCTSRVARRRVSGSGRACGRRRARPSTGYLVVNGKLVKPTGGAPAILASEAPDFRVSKLVDGALRVAPAAEPDLAVDKGIADREH